MATIANHLILNVDWRLQFQTISKKNHLKKFYKSIAVSNL